MNIFSDPYFGLVLTIVIYFLSIKILERIYIPILNPLILSLLSIISVLYFFKIPYESYFVGGNILNILIGPATVALALPLYKSVLTIKKYLLEILISLSITSFITCLSVILFSKLFHFSDELIISILPKTITTAIGIEISQQMHGIVSITIITIILTGNIGAIMSSFVFNLLKVDDPFIKGIALGTSAHAIGTAKAIELGMTEGALSGVSMSITGILVVFIAPLTYFIFG